MMKLLALLLTISASSVFGQSPADQGRNAPDLEIEHISWRGGMPQGTIFDPRGAFSIDVKNTGTRTVKKVAWEFYVIDPIRKYVTDTLHFVTDNKDVKPGQKVRLTKRIEYQQDLPKYMQANARVMRVEYVDGSVWARSDN